ncbi:PKD domain-containing protein, partial [Candidatus Parvarchaeota archaeon]|nr:PKD domain-containing protein [Candidatus Parvarchaeota archaeon]
DPEGGVITYTVKFGDGESRDLGTYPSNKEVVIEKKYQSAGSYYITVTAKDDAGKTVESGTNVNVNAPANKPPVIDGVGGDYELKVNQQGTWTVKAHDPDGTQLFYAVIWGDEPSIENAKKSIKVPYSGSEATFQHTYANAGKYTARFFVSDSAGAVVETTYTVKVSQDAKLCQKSANEVRSALGGSEFGDLGLDTSAHPEILKYRIQWFSGGWSDWYTPGQNDIDWKVNNDGSQRRVWGYFADHTHEIVKCIDPKTL